MRPESKPTSGPAGVDDTFFHDGPALRHLVTAGGKCAGARFLRGAWSRTRTVHVDVGRMIHLFREGFDHFGVFWESVIRPENFARLRDLYHAPEREFRLPPDVWARIVCDFSATFKAWDRHRAQLVETWNMDNARAEEVIDQQAQRFETLKPYLIESWQSGEKLDTTSAGATSQGLQ